MANFNYQLGLKLRDMVSGLEGIATSRVEFINGCIQYGVSGKADNGKIPDTHYIDQQQLEVVDNGIVIKSQPTGGPRSDTPKGLGLSHQ